MFSRVLTIVLVLTWGSKVTEAALGFSASSNNMVLSSDYQTETPTELVFTFDFVNALVNTKEITIVTNPANGDLFESTGTTCVITDSNGATLTADEVACITADSGSGNRDSLVCTVGTNGITSDAHTITCTGGIKPNPQTYFNWKFDMSHDHTGSESTTGEEGWKVGLPRIYFRRSECRANGEPHGALVTGAGDPIKTCDSSRNFVVKSGIQLVEGNSGTCYDGNKNKNRCDAMYFTDNTIDIAVSTYGNFGTLTCGAFTTGQSAATVSNLMNLVDNNKQAANSVYVTEADRYVDHVVSLTNLESDLQYDVYCHMDEVVYSPYLTVWTDENDRLWGDSFVPDTTSVKPAYYTLTFSHGKELVADDVIVVTTSEAIFTNSGTPACEGWSDGIKHTTDPTSSVTGAELSITLQVTSPKGSKLQIICNTEIANHPGNTDTVTYELDGDSDRHPRKLLNRYGWKWT
jgi:hypothetical protein